MSWTLFPQLRQCPVGLSAEVRTEPRTVETQNGRLIEVERSVSDRIWNTQGMVGKVGRDGGSGGVRD